LLELCVVHDPEVEARSADARIIYDRSSSGRVGALPRVCRLR
jgi:hypothetical protein